MLTVSRKKAKDVLPILEMPISDDVFPKLLLTFIHLIFLISGILYNPLPPMKAISIFSF